MVAETVAIVVLVLAATAEALHARRCRRLGWLAFGPTANPRKWAHAAPWLQTIAMATLAWGLMTLWEINPKLHSGEVPDESEIKQLLLVLDVSPSMFLEDAGPDRKQARRKRASDVLGSLFNRLPMREYRVSLIAFYTDAKPLLKESTDREILRHILEELPTYQGFKAGKTDLFAGLTAATRFAKAWRPKSATLVVVTDGMTVPPSGMPRMPPAIAQVLVVGVGDPHAGKFLDGQQSRQDTVHLRQIANRLGGVYHNANVKHLPSSIINFVRFADERHAWATWTRREWALASIAIGSLVLSLLPALLHWRGTAWQPGVPATKPPAPLPVTKPPGQPVSAATSLSVVMVSK